MTPISSGLVCTHWDKPFILREEEAKQMKIQINQKIWLEGVAGVSGDEEEGESEIEGERSKHLVPFTLLLSPNQLSCLLESRHVFWEGTICKWAGSRDAIDWPVGSSPVHPVLTAFWEYRPHHSGVVSWDRTWLCTAVGHVVPALQGSSESMY